MAYHSSQSTSPPSLRCRASRSLTTPLDVEQHEAPLRGLIHSLHREELAERVRRLRFSRRAAAAKHARTTTPTPTTDEYHSHRHHPTRHHRV